MEEILIHRHAGGVAMHCPACGYKRTIRRDGLLVHHRRKDSFWCEMSLAKLSPNPYLNRAVLTVQIACLYPDIPARHIVWEPSLPCNTDVKAAKKAKRKHKKTRKRMESPQALPKEPPACATAYWVVVEGVATAPARFATHPEAQTYAGGLSGFHKGKRVLILTEHQETATVTTT